MFINIRMAAPGAHPCRRGSLPRGAWMISLSTHELFAPESKSPYESLQQHGQYRRESASWVSGGESFRTAANARSTPRPAFNGRRCSRPSAAATVRWRASFPQDRQSTAASARSSSHRHVIFFSAGGCDVINARRMSQYARYRSLTRQLRHAQS